MTTHRISARGGNDRRAVTAFCYLCAAAGEDSRNHPASEPCERLTEWALDRGVKRSTRGVVTDLRAVLDGRQ